jgi:Mrp family chromosome partitioning ATPase
VDRPTTLSDYLAILRRRKWIIVVMLVVVPVTAIVISAVQKEEYQATTQVLINRANIVSAITNVTDPSTLGTDPTRFLATQSDVAQSPTLAKRVVAAARIPGITGTELLAASNVSPASNADILNISVSNARPSYAIRLANVYAEQYTLFKTDLDTSRINDALTTLRSRISALAKAGVPATSPSYATLLDDQSRLETVGRLLANNTQVVRSADHTVKVRPRTRRNALLGALFGVILGIGLSFVAEALDRRVKSANETEAILGLPLLARIPRPTRRLEKANRLVTIAQPKSIDAESFRKLQTNLEFVNLERQARKIAVTSAGAQEGKSTTIANLGVVLARAGRKVALVDLDLRRPFLEKFFAVPAAPGVTDVALGHAGLADALRPIPIRGASPIPPADAPMPAASSVAATNGGTPHGGALNLLPAGTRLSDPGEFIAHAGIRPVLDQLAEEFDYILLDTPPFVAVGDTMALSPHVDAIVVVTRLRFVPRSLLRDLARQLDTCQAAPLGYVLAGAELEESYDETRYYYSYTPTESPRVEERLR